MSRIGPLANDVGSESGSQPRYPFSMRITPLLVVLLLSGCLPIDQFPGLRLGGSVAPAPSNFDFVAEHEEITLRAEGAMLPRVVTIWGVGFPDALYVWGDPASGWTRRVAKRPDVMVRIGDDAFELRAEKVSDRSELERVVAAYAAKYGEDLDAIFGRPATVDDFALVYRLTPRG
jgi:hypothetical protein